MGLAASQARYLALTARKSDLELQSQTINTRRIQLAYKTQEIARAYSDGMNNEKIKISHIEGEGNKSNTVWEELTFSNLLNNGYGSEFVLIGANGGKLQPSPYKITGSADSTDYKRNTSDAAVVTISATAYAKLDANDKSAYELTEGSDVASDDATYTLKSSVTKSEYDELSDTYKSYFDEPSKTTTIEYDKEAYASQHGLDIQTLLTSGKAQIVTKAFFDFLNEKGYTWEKGLNSDVFYDLVEQFENKNKGVDTVVEWQADGTNNAFQQKSYTEDDAAVLAKYEAETAKIQAQDKILETEEKNIETQHKAIETELDGLKKVIEGNIDKTFKMFS